MGASSWFTSFKRAFTSTKRHPGNLHDNKKREENRLLLTKSPNNIYQTQLINEKLSSNYALETSHGIHSAFIKHHFSATLIQTAFRGYLARKAARALKGIVMLQAMIRGQLVRNHTITTFRFIQVLHHVQTRKEANPSRNIKKLQERANWLVQWMEAKQQMRSSYGLSVSQDFATPFTIKTKSSQVQLNSTRSTPRNSSYSNYMDTPNYMAPTESTKAKTRSKSSPRLAPLTPDQKEQIVFVRKQLSYTDQDFQ